MKKKRYSRQYIKKKTDGKCFICSEDNYKVLDAHRIIEGGTYHKSNVLTLCVKCHRLTHNGDIKFDRKYNSTSGHPVVHFWYKEQEYWIDETKGFNFEQPSSEH